MAPIIAFLDAGHEVSVLSVAGGKIPMDEASMNAPFRTEEVDKFLAGGMLILASSGKTLFCWVFSSMFWDATRKSSRFGRLPCCYLLAREF